MVPNFCTPLCLPVRAAREEPGDAQTQSKPPLWACAESQGLVSEVANTLTFSLHSFFPVLEHSVFIFAFTKEESEALSEEGRHP